MNLANTVLNILSIIGILIVPAVSLMFLDNSSDLRSDISSSRFIGRNRIRKSQAVKRPDFLK